jgi:protein disulfide-isomerase A1
MKLFIVTLLLASVIRAEEGTWGLPEEDHVVILTTENFDAFLESHPMVFVEFYAPWCGHCQSMAPAYSSLAERMKDLDNGVPVAKIDATVETELGERYGVEGFPTIKLFKNGEAIDFQGEREEDAMYDWLVKKMGPSATELDAAEVSKLEKENLALIFFYPESDEEALQTFMQVAEKIEDIPCRYSTNVALKETFDSAPYALVLLRNFDDGKKHMVGSDGFEVENMLKFVGMHMFPIVMDFNEKAAERIFGSEKPAFLMLTDNEDSEEMTTFRAFASEHKGRIYFSRSEISEGLGARLAEFLGVTTEEDPTVRIIQFKQNNLSKYVVNDLSTDGLLTALNKFEEGTLEAYHKSDPIPETNDEQVKVVVGTSYAEMVLDNDKFVLLEVYAPWCGHCQQLEPIYKELAEKTASLENLVIAKIDATTNEHSSLNIEGFPTILMFKPGQKNEPVTYEGDRTLDDLIQFLEKETGLAIMETLVQSEEL